MKEKKIDEAIEKAVSSSNIDQIKPDKKTLKIIKKALQNPEQSFLSKLYDLVMEEHHGKSK